jgi:adenosyl cobinamide kinase/adenosyl cobinamide phosphate guanylyltransferase
VITLVIGGASSGKSEIAERLAATLPEPVTYVATWPFPADDADMAARIARHRARRPASWATVDAGVDLPEVILGTAGTVLVDSLGTWVAAREDFAVDAPGLCSALRTRVGDAVVVSDEVGMGVHPATDAGRRFREALGSLNAAVAAVADPVWLVVAGRLLALDPPPLAVAAGAALRAGADVGARAAVGDGTGPTAGGVGGVPRAAGGEVARSARAEEES